MAKVLESLIAKGRRARRPPEQKEVAFGLADLSTHGKKVVALIFPQNDFANFDAFFYLTITNCRGIVGANGSERRCQITPYIAR